jgi:uncharacterized protein involved in exopolysaccharide biosynthesis
LFDWKRLSSYGAYALGSVRRHPLLFVAVLVAALGAGAAVVHVLPPVYQVETRLLAQRNAALAVRGDQHGADLPTRAATEMIVRRDNLSALVKETNLRTEWRARRSLAGRMKDAFFRALGRGASDDELEEGLVGLLQKQLSAWSSPEGAVVIRLDWPDREMAYRLVDAAQRNFLETRHVLEVSTLAEQISILDEHAAKLKREINERVAALERLRLERLPAPRRPAPRRPVPMGPSPDVTRLQVMLDGKRRAISDLEDFRRRAQLDAQTRLAELRVTLAPTHPSIVDQELKIQALNAESPQLARLRQEEEQLRKELGGRADRGLEATTLPAAAIAHDVFQFEPTDDSLIESARAQLRFVLQQYATLRDRTDSARIDLDTARAAFKYRYSVILPPERPKKPLRPNPPLVYCAALFAGLLAALLSTTMVDLHRGLVHARWQLEDLTGGPVIEARSD